ncbi:MAG: pyridoxal phosphate-dependent aminotransferase [Alphaproteobacteria bacterium]|nr:pyridoxal phosphate-dependent aminotransferase [Alphaproteobacteria bacterium]
MASFKRADRISSVAVSDIVVMSEAARARRAEGVDVISLGIGEPDFTTPQHVNDAAIAAIHAHDTKYPPIAGKPELRAAVAARYDGMTPENIVVSSGSKYSLLNAFMASLNPGDEVIIPAPFWTSYADIVTMAGGKVVVLPTSADTGFQLDPEKLRAAMSPRSRWILINTPSNPTGAIMSPERMRAVGEILADYPDCWLMSDEIYEHLTYGVDFHSAYDVLPHLRDRMLIINGVSKAYAMTGWRVGFGIGPADLIKAMIAVQAQGTSGTCTIAQAAAIAALTGPQGLLAERRQSFHDRRDLVLSHLNAMDGLDTPTPEGAFYTFTRWTSLQGGITPYGDRLTTDRDFCEYILKAADTAIIPGTGFAAEGHFRISYASSTEELTTALTRMASAIAAITRP